MMRLLMSRRGICAMATTCYKLATSAFGGWGRSRLSTASTSLPSVINTTTTTITVTTITMSTTCTTSMTTTFRWQRSYEAPVKSAFVLLWLAPSTQQIFTNRYLSSSSSSSSPSSSSPHRPGRYSSTGICLFTIVQCHCHCHCHHYQNHHFNLYPCYNLFILNINIFLGQIFADFHN